MDYYMKRVSKDIQGGYQCYQKNFLQRFSVPELSDSEREYLLNEDDQEKINNFLVDKYDISLPE
jgi:hypothetical protein